MMSRIRPPRILGNRTNRVYKISLRYLEKTRKQENSVEKSRGSFLKEPNGTSRNVKHV